MYNTNSSLEKFEIFSSSKCPADYGVNSVFCSRNKFFFCPGGRGGGERGPGVFSKIKIKKKNLKKPKI